MKYRTSLLTLLLTVVSLFAQAQVTVSKGVYKELAYTTDTLQVYRYKEVFSETLKNYPVSQDRLKELLVSAVLLYCEDEMAKRTGLERDTVFLTIAEGKLPSTAKTVQYRALKIGKSKGVKKKDNVSYTQIQWGEVEEMEIGAAGAVVISWDDILNDVEVAIEADLEYEYPGSLKFFGNFRKLLADQFIAFEDTNKEPVFFPFNCKSCMEKEARRLKDEISEIQSDTILEE